MAQVASFDAELQPVKATPAMKYDQATDQDSVGEQIAQSEWNALLVRLRHRAAAERRVEAVRSAIVRGVFHVDASAIAERLIARLLAS
jgi:anti-sigma28 factor (negative regulator of flagellin synthesis)